MKDAQEAYDDAMFEFSRAEYDQAISGLKQVLRIDPDHFDALLSLGMAFYRKGDYARAVRYGHAAERLRPDEALVHTNLSLSYMKSGDRQKAEAHGFKARIASWKGKTAPAVAPSEGDGELSVNGRPRTGYKTPERFPDMPWTKRKRPPGEAAGR